MSLFPAYAPESDENKQLPALDEVLPTLSNHLSEEIDDICNPKGISANSEDEAQLLETSSDSPHSSDGNSSKRKRKLDSHTQEPPSKKKKKSKHKKHQKEKQKKDITIEDDSDFYIDRKPDLGNLHVSKLYYPAIPQYYTSKIGVSIIISDEKKSKKRWKRYFEVDVRFLNEKNYNTDQPDDKTEKRMGDFVNIADSKKRWDDSRIEKELMEKTAEFNKYFAEHPNDVDKWLEFVQFQENHYSFDVLNYRAVTESSARDVCRQKQLSILDVALSHNPRDRQLLDAKLRLSRIMKPSAEYLNLLKDLIANETNPSTKAQLWCALTDGVFGSAALCSASSVRDSYAAAIVAMKRDQKAYLELLYRYGLFLRQAGLFEQLHLLLDLVTAMNFTQKTDAFQPHSGDKVDAREKVLADEETQLMKSGLPTSAVWTRVESARSIAHWLLQNGAQMSADPQCCPDVSDVADFIAPVTKHSQLFTLTVHVLRLANVPLLSPDNTTTCLLRSLHPLLGSHPEWEADSAEHILPLLLEMPRPMDYSMILARHAALPNYLQHGEYLTFVEKLFAACLEWTTGREQLAILIWWIRFQAALLALNTGNRSEAVRVRKSLQRVLKLHGDSPLAFAEFSRLEAAACGPERGAQVAVVALRSAEQQSRAQRMAISRCVCDVGGPGSWSLVCAVLGRALPRDLALDAPPSRKLLIEALTECERRSEELWKQAADDYEDLEPTECMLPSDDTEWWICRYELLARLGKAEDSEHGEKLIMLADEAKTPRQLRMHEAASTALISHTRKNRSCLARKLLKKHPHNARLAVAAGTRSAMPTLPPPPPPSPLAAIATVIPLLLECEESDTQTPSVGFGRRALSVLRSLTSSGAAGVRSSLLWRLRIDAEARLDGGNAKTALYLALDACPAAKQLYVEGARAAPSEFAELTDLLLEKQLRLHTLPEELEPL